MVKIYYDKYGRIYASWNKRNDLLLGEVEVGDTFKILYDDTDCDGCIKRTSFEGGLDDEGFLRDFTSKCFKDEVDGMDPDDDNIDIKYYVIECKVVEVNDTLDVESVGDYKWSMTYSRNKLNKEDIVMTKEEIRNTVMNAAKEYGYNLIMTEFGHTTNKKEFLKRMEDDFNYLYDGEDFDDLFDRIQVDDDTNLFDMMNEGKVFSYDNVSDWYSIGKNKAWKELIQRNQIKIDNIYVVGIDANRPMKSFHSVVTDSFEDVEQTVSQWLWTYSDATIEVFKNDKLIKHLNIK